MLVRTANLAHRTIGNLACTDLFRVLCEVVDAQVVDDVSGADQDGRAVHLEQLEVVLVRLVTQEAADVACQEKKLVLNGPFTRASC